MIPMICARSIFIRRFSRRGTAEIELVLAIPLLLLLFFMARAMAWIHIRQQEAVAAAERAIFSQTTAPDLYSFPGGVIGRPASLQFQDYPDIPRIDNFSSVWYRGTGRTQVPTPFLEKAGAGAVRFNVSAISAGPEWNWTGYPHLSGSGSSAVREWYRQCVDQAIDPVCDPLNLQRE